jgi:hypothetical protein
MTRDLCWTQLPKRQLASSQAYNEVVAAKVRSADELDKWYRVRSFAAKVALSRNEVAKVVKKARMRAVHALDIFLETAE